MQIPTPQQIESLHKKYAPNALAFNEVWQHCIIVKNISVWCINNSKLAHVDQELVEAGCLLHDMGVYKLYKSDGQLDYDNYIMHGTLGYQILIDEGFSEELCRFASHHTGVGITAEEIKKNGLPLPPEDYLAESLEERLVMYADKFHSKDPSQFNSTTFYKNHLATKLGLEKVQLFEEMIAEFGTPPVKQLAKEYNQPLR